MPKGYPEEFLKATRQICEDLGINQRSVKYERWNAGNLEEGFDARGINNHCEFVFTVTVDKEKSEMTDDRFLHIRFDNNARPFEFNDRRVDHHYKLDKWAAIAMYEIRTKHTPVNLDSLFNDMHIRVYGMPGYTISTIPELRFLMSAIKERQHKLVVYKFRHLDDDAARYRSLSYAFLINEGDFWIIFPRLGGLDSGTASGHVEEAEKLIAELPEYFRVERRNFDVPYQELERFLIRRSSGFHSMYSVLDYYKMPDIAGVFGEEFERDYEEFKKMYLSDNYTQALRALRALVEEALKLLYRKSKVGIEKRNAKINDFSEALIDRQIIDGELRYWFGAFSSTANLAAHGVYPTNTELNNDVLRHRIVITFLIGTHIIIELEKSALNIKSNKS